MKYQKLTLNKKNITDFAKERNNLLKNAREDWVFFVDKDETVSPALGQEIRQLHNNSIIQSYYIKRNNFFLKQYVGTDKIIRLVKKGSGKWVRAVHETFQPSHPAGVMKNTLQHNTADNLSNYLNKINSYSTLHAFENEKEGKKASLTKIIFFPIFKFFVTLVKSKHIVFSIMASLHSFLSWSKQYLKNHKS